MTDPANLLRELIYQPCQKRLKGGILASFHPEIFAQNAPARRVPGALCIQKYQWSVAFCKNQSTATDASILIIYIVIKCHCFKIEGISLFTFLVLRLAAKFVYPDHILKYVQHIHVHQHLNGPAQFLMGCNFCIITCKWTIHKTLKWAPFTIEIKCITIYRFSNSNSRLLYDNHPHPYRQLKSHFSWQLIIAVEFDVASYARWIIVCGFGLAERYFRQNFAGFGIMGWPSKSALLICLYYFSFTKIATYKGSVDDSP